MGELSIDEVDERMERAGRPDKESIRARPQPVRFELGDRGGHCGQSRGDWCWYRDRWLNRLSVVGEWPGGYQAHRRSREPLGHHPDLALAGHGRPDDEDGCRRRATADRPGRLRCPRRGDEVRRCEGRRLREEPRRRRPQRRAHRRGAEAVLRLQPVRRSAHRRGDCRHEGARCGDCRSGRHPDGCDHRRLRARDPPLRVQGRAQRLLEGVGGRR